MGAFNSIKRHQCQPVDRHAVESRPFTHPEILPIPPSNHRKSVIASRSKFPGPADGWKAAILVRATSPALAHVSLAVWLKAIRGVWLIGVFG